jgi:putative DNA primase/helicase
VPCLVGVLGWNQSEYAAYCLSPPPWELLPGVRPLAVPRRWSDSDDTRTMLWLQQNSLLVGRETATYAVQTVAHDHPYHPIRDWLSSLVWDGESRLDYWLFAYLSVEHSPYVSAIGARFLIGMCARVFRPGCLMDTCLVLQGGAGTYKSRALRTLAAPWFTDHISELGSTNSMSELRGVWLVELAELDAILSARTGRIKEFLSRTADRFRPAYGRRLVVAPRECVFAGTYNHDTWMRDEDGGEQRRFWPVRTGCIDLDRLAEDRDQLFAEALVRYQAGAVWHLDTAELVTAAADEQSERLERDPWEEPIALFCSSRQSVSVSDILRTALHIEPERQTRTHQMRAARCLKLLGWHRYRAALPNGTRPYLYQRKP